LQTVAGTVGGHFARLCPVDFGLPKPECVALDVGCCRSLNTAEATPAVACLGQERTHLLFGMVFPAAVTEYRFGHFILEKGKDIEASLA
jgi:hypothetical protein